MKVHMRTDIGLVRKKNEDFVSQFINLEKEHLVVVADGIGGSNGGEVASHLVVSKLGLNFSMASFKTANRIDVQQWFTEKLTQLNNEIVQKSEKDPELTAMGTTIVFAYFNQKECLIGNVGDSRAYQFKNNKLQILTDDHTFVNALYKMDEITKEEAENHPDRHKLIRAIGIPVENNVEIDYAWHNLQDGDLYLLCSDGLTNMLSDKEITDILQKNMPTDKKADLLVDKAKEAGGRDNITLAIVENKEVSK